MQEWRRAADGHAPHTPSEHRALPSGAVPSCAARRRATPHALRCLRETDPSRAIPCLDPETLVSPQIFLRKVPVSSYIRRAEFTEVPIALTFVLGTRVYSHCLCKSQGDAACSS